jgi:hypothetical protein
MSCAICVWGWGVKSGVLIRADLMELGLGDMAKKFGEKGVK